MGSDAKTTDIIRELTTAGWTLLRHGGNHDVYGCPCGEHIVAVPRHRVLSPGVAANIRRAIANCNKGA